MESNEYHGKAELEGVVHKNAELEGDYKNVQELALTSVKLEEPRVVEVEGSEIHRAKNELDVSPT